MQIAGGESLNVDSSIRTKIQTQIDVQNKRRNVLEVEKADLEKVIRLEQQIVKVEASAPDMKKLTYWEGQRETAANTIQAKTEYLERITNQLNATIEKAKAWLQTCEAALETLHSETAKPTSMKYKRSKARLDLVEKELAEMGPKVYTVDEVLEKAMGVRKAAAPAVEAAPKKAAKEPKVAPTPAKVVQHPIEQEEEEESLEDVEPPAAAPPTHLPGGLPTPSKKWLKDWEAGETAETEEEFNDFMAFQRAKHLPRLEAEVASFSSVPAPESFPNARLLTDTKVRNVMLKGKARRNPQN